MKHTKKRLLAVLLVLAMALGMAPMAALTVGAESAIVDTITVDENRAITDLEWSTAYVSSPYNADGKAGQVVKRWSGAYRLSEIVTVPKAGTTLVWTDPASVGALGEGEFFITSWKNVGENEWELDRTGANLVAAGLANNANQFYDSVNQTVTYTYTTTADNEAVRFAAYGYTAEGELSRSPEECPKVYAYEPVYAEGAVSGVTWNLGAVVPSGFDAALQRSAEGYVYSNPILISKADTTLSWNAACGAEAYAISVWRVAENGTLEFVYGCEGSDANNAWTTVKDGVTTYAYTSSYDNEFIRICVKGAAPAITYVEDNAASYAPILKAAGYDPAQAGTPYMLKWYGGLMGVDGNRFVPAGEGSAYRVSDVLPVYAAGTTVTFTDMVNGEDASADDFADETVYTIALFDGTEYKGLNANNVLTLTEGVLMGDTAENREVALENGKRVYAYTTTAADEYLRLSFCCLGNEVNGGIVAPIVYISAPGEGYYYNSLNELTVYSVWAQETFWGESYDNDTWLSALAARYGWTYLDVNDQSAGNVDPEDADVVIYHAIGVESAPDVEDLFESGYMTVLISDDKDLVTEIEAMNNDFICAIYIYDLPYRVFWDYEVYNEAYMGLYADDMGLNADGHELLAPWLETTLGENYRDYDGITDEGAPVIKFVNNNTVMGMISTTAGERSFTVPGAPTGVLNDNMFGWFGMMKNPDGSETLRVFAAGEKVTVPQGASGTFAPLCIGMEQQSGAELNADNTAAGLTFLATMNDLEYKNVLQMIENGQLGNASLTLGMLIATEKSVAALDGGMTHASLAAAGLSVTDVAAISTMGELRGTLAQLRVADRNSTFVARGYAKLTVEGVDYYVYAANEGVEGVKPYELAVKALNDCSPMPKEGYPNEVSTAKGKAYSPYTEAQRSILKGLTRGVAEITTVIDPETGMLTAELFRGEYFDPNTRRECYTVVGGGSDSLTDIFYDNGLIPNKQMAVKSADWNALLQALGDDGTGVDAVCVITAATGYEIDMILQDGLELTIVEYVYEGNVCYLLGFSSHTPFI